MAEMNDLENVVAELRARIAAADSADPAQKAMLMSFAPILEMLEQSIEQAKALNIDPTGMDSVTETAAQIAQILEATRSPMKYGDPKSAMEAVNQIPAQGSGSRLAEDDSAQQDDQHEKFMEAVEGGDMNALRTMLPDADVNRQYGEYGATPLYTALSGLGDNVLEVAELLLDAGADPTYGLGSESNALHGLGFGPAHRDTDHLTRVVTRCVERGADIEQRTGHLRWTPLITAIYERNASAVEALLRAGADANAVIDNPNAGISSLKTALMSAITAPRIFDLLLRHGADPSRQAPNGQTVRDYLDEVIAEGGPADFTRELYACRDMLDRHAPNG